MSFVGLKYFNNLLYQLEILLRYNFLVFYISMLLLLVNFIAVMSAIKLDKLVSESVAEQMTALAVSVLISLAVSFVLCLVWGIKYIIPIKEMAVFILFFSVKFINKKKIKSVSNLIKS